nr:1931_t:CDS:2 [Entrophospora candida]
MHDVAKIYDHGKTFLTFNEEKENLSKQILQIKDEYNDLIKEKDKTIAEFKKSMTVLRFNNITLTNNNNDLNSKILGKDAANDELIKKNFELQNFYSTLIVKYNDLVQEYNNLKERLLSQIAINEGLYENQNNQYVSQLNKLKKHNSELQLQHDRNVVNNKKRKSIQFSQDLSELQDKIQSYITNLRTTTAELDYNNIDNLLIKYNYVAEAKEIQRNKPLVKALLQRAVFDKLIELLKDFGSDTYQYKSQNLRGLEYDLYELANKLYDYSFESDSYEWRSNQYRKIIDQRKQTELATLSGEIIRDFIKIFHFTLLEDLDDLEICWIINGSAIDSEFMEGQWDYHNIDNYVVEICRFPLIRSSKKIYSLAKVFADKLDNSNTIIKSNTSLEVIKWNANAKDKLGTKTGLVSETRFGGGGWTTETATDDEFDELYGEPKSETLVNAESKELSKTCYELVEETTTKKGKVITGNSTAVKQSCDKKEATSAIGSVFSTFFGRHDTKSIETTQTIISKQTNEGSFHISDTLSEILEISSDTKSQSFKSTIQTYAVSKCLKETTTHHTWWTTAITISYLKLHAFSHETTWKIQYEKARKYLSEQIKDTELEEELLKTCCNLVEEKTTKKVVYTETNEEIVERKEEIVERKKEIAEKEQYTTKISHAFISSSKDEKVAKKDDYHTTTNVGSVKHHHDKKVEEKKQNDTKHKKEETEQETIIQKISHVFGSSKEEEKAKNEELKEKEQNTSKISHAFASEDEETIEKKEKDDHHTTKFIAGDVTTVKHSYDKKREKKHEEEHSATEGVVSGVTSTIGSVFSGFFGKIS